VPPTNFGVCGGFRKAKGHLPCEEKPDNPRRVEIGEINRLLVDFARANHFDLLDLAPKMLKPDGTLPRELMPDFCHPNEKGYAIWADALRPLLGVPSK
jgi:lysophospholipase L1-like esterase